MTAPERSPERDAALEAALPAVPRTGWTMRTLTEAAGPDADLLFPDGPLDMIEAYIDLADRRMEDAAAADHGLAALRTPARVRSILALRFAQNRQDKDAIRRAFGLLSTPANAPLAGRCTARTVDAVWRAAGDEADGFSFYSKRAILAGVYGATLLYWFADDSPDDERTLAFLDRRLAAVGRITRLRRRLTERFG